MKHSCPVCGYPDLQEAPINFEICPSCGTQFGYDDFLRSHEDIRQEWITNSAKWFLTGYEPYGWNAYRQLENAGFLEFEDSSKTRSSVANVYHQSRAFEIIEVEKSKIVTNCFVIGRQANGLGCFL